MAELLTTQAAPLAKDSQGVIRIKGSRVTLDVIVREFKEGFSAEQILEDFPSLSLREIYGAVSYYLDNTESVEEYLRERKTQAARTREEVESRQDSSELRQRLRQQRSRLAR